MNLKIKRSDYDNIWFTSDLHLFHKNILKFQKNREFNSVEEMNNFIIEMWNDTVGENDLVFILGDVSFGYVGMSDIINDLKGKKYLIIGNHDTAIVNSSIKYYFYEVTDYIYLTIDKQKIVLFHYPVYEWSGIQYGAFHLHGHSHGNMDNVIDGRILDVGLDGKLGFKLNSYEDICRYMKNLPIINRYRTTDMREGINSIVKDTVRDLAKDFLYLNRKEDDELPLGKIEELIENDNLTKEDIVTIFKNELYKELK